LIALAKRHLGDEPLGGITGERDRFDVVERDAQIPATELTGKRELASGIDPLGLDVGAVPVDERAFVVPLQGARGAAPEHAHAEQRQRHHDRRDRRQPPVHAPAPFPAERRPTTEPVVGKAWSS